MFSYSGGQNGSIKVATVEKLPDRPSKKKNRFNLYDQQSALVELSAGSEPEVSKWISSMENTITGDVITRITWHQVKGSCKPSDSILEKSIDSKVVAWDSGASSVDALGYSATAVQGVSWTVSTQRKGFMIGLSHVDSDENFTTIDFALACSAYDTLGVYERGVKTFQHGSYVPGDTLSVIVQGETVSMCTCVSALWTAHIFEHPASVCQI
jgi:hypothetical protein